MCVVWHPLSMKVMEGDFFTVDSLPTHETSSQAGSQSRQYSIPGPGMLVGALSTIKDELRHTADFCVGLKTVMQSYCVRACGYVFQYA